jgi:hypothetical protein
VAQCIHLSYRPARFVVDGRRRVAVGIQDRSPPASSTLVRLPTLSHWYSKLEMTASSASKSAADVNRLAASYVNEVRAPSAKSFRVRCPAAS